MYLKSPWVFTVFFHFQLTSCKFLRNFQMSLQSLWEFKVVSHFLDSSQRFLRNFEGSLKSHWYFKVQYHFLGTSLRFSRKSHGSLKNHWGFSVLSNWDYRTCGFSSYSYLTLLSPACVLNIVHNVLPLLHRWISTVDSKRRIQQWILDLFHFTSSSLIL